MRGKNETGDAIAYARWHRLASENLLDATLKPGQDQRLQFLFKADNYAQMAFDECGNDPYLMCLNQGIISAIAMQRRLIERNGNDYT